MKKNSYLLITLVVIMVLCMNCVIYNAGRNSIPDLLYEIKHDRIFITGYLRKEINIIIPEKIRNRPVEIIGRNAFRDRADIESLLISNTVIEISDTAFANCTSLTHVTLSKNLQYIQDGAFYNCNIFEIVIPGSVKGIGSGAFSECPIEQIIIPENIEYLGGAAFYNETIKSIRMPGNLNYHGKDSFNMAFPYSFDAWYEIADRREGLYTYKNNVWHYDGEVLTLGSYGLLTERNGANILSINDKIVSGYTKIIIDQEKNILLEPGTYNIKMNYIMSDHSGTYRSLSDQNFDVTIRPGRKIIITGYRESATGGSFNWGYDINEE